MKAVQCKCGFIHQNADQIVYRRDPVANRVKPVCAQCNRRLFTSRSTTNTIEFRNYFRQISASNL